MNSRWLYWQTKSVSAFFAASVLAIFIFMLGVSSLAQDSAPPAPNTAAPPRAGPKATKRTNVDFEDQLVQGEVKKPELFYLLQKKQFNFGKLIKLRENFIPEMSKTAEDVEKTK